MKFTKALDGRALQAGEFEFILEKDGVEVERVKNDAAGKINFKKLEFGKNDLGKTYNYTDVKLQEQTQLSHTIPWLRL